MFRRESALVVACLVACSVRADAQTDYYNTDAGRPLAVEDASALERYAFELQLAPLRVERVARGSYRWSVEPEIAYGILPRTQVEVATPLIYDDTRRRKSGLGGLELSVLHNLNVETSLPALALAGEVLLPVGGMAPADALFSTRGILTRTFRWARIHLNASYTFGDADEIETEPSVPESNEPGEAHGTSRWIAGVALDRTFPLMSTLFGAELLAKKAREGDSDVEWTLGAGMRRQLSPVVSIDAGAGKTLSAGGSWYFTFGVARSFAVRALMPVR